MRYSNLLNLSMWALSACADFSTNYEYHITNTDCEQEAITWEVTEAPPFNELILSWNAIRSSESAYTFYVSLHQDHEWSPWLYYGDWGSRGQMLCVESQPDSFAETNRGIVRPKKAHADGFRIQVCSIGRDRLCKLERLAACASDLDRFTPSMANLAFELKPIELKNIPPQSLYTLRLPRHWDMSMIASMLSALRYLSNQELDPTDLIDHIMDADFESYDFWPLHAAEAFHRLNGAFRVQIEHLPHFTSLHEHLMKGTPVLINILGTPMGGMPWPPYRSHILCVLGYNQGKVLCMDPAFPSNSSTYVSYSLDDFIRVWAKKHHIACVFIPK